MDIPLLQVSSSLRRPASPDYARTLGSVRRSVCGAEDFRSCCQGPSTSRRMGPSARRARKTTTRGLRGGRDKSTGRGTRGTCRSVERDHHGLKMSWKFCWKAHAFLPRSRLEHGDLRTPRREAYAGMAERAGLSFEAAVRRHRGRGWRKPSTKAEPRCFWTCFFFGRAGIYFFDV